MRGDITIWLSLDVIDQWTIADRQYEGSGAPLLFSDMAMMTVHEIHALRVSTHLVARKIPNVNTYMAMLKCNKFYCGGMHLTI